MTKWHPVNTAYREVDWNMELDWLGMTLCSGSLSAVLQCWCWCQQEPTSNVRDPRAPWGAKAPPSLSCLVQILSLPLVNSFFICKMRKYHGPPRVVRRIQENHAYFTQCLVHCGYYMMVIVIKMLINNADLLSGFSLSWSLPPCPSNRDKPSIG